VRLFGSWVALITPFSQDNSINFEGIKKLIDFHIDNGTDGILFLGTTGENPAIDYNEKIEIIEYGIKHVNGRIQTMVGSGTNNTNQSIEMTEIARSAGADFALVITPYYNKPNQEGLYRHFSKVSDSVDIPIVIYNVPGRTGVKIFPDTLSRLTTKTNIVAVKEASGDVDLASEMILKTEGKIDIISGNDSLTVPLISIGCTGVISVIANIVPDYVSKMVHYALNSDWEKAKELHYKLLLLSKAMFIETNPIPVKTAANIMKLPSGPLRLPLGPISEDNRQKLIYAMNAFGIK
jgi:4-hydroxy-tetrahydrodipicolinate synthase